MVDDDDRLMRTLGGGDWQWREGGVNYGGDVAFEGKTCSAVSGLVLIPTRIHTYLFVNFVYHAT
jgi:hypothetical protein